VLELAVGREVVAALPVHRGDPADRARHHAGLERVVRQAVRGDAGFVVHGCSSFLSGIHAARGTPPRSGWIGSPAIHTWLTARSSPSVISANSRSSGEAARAVRRASNGVAARSSATKSASRPGSKLP